MFGYVIIIVITTIIIIIMIIVIIRRPGAVRRAPGRPGLPPALRLRGRRSDPGLRDKHIKKTQQRTKPNKQTVQCRKTSNINQTNHLTNVN